LSHHDRINAQTHLILSISGALFIGRELKQLGFYWLEALMDEHSLSAYAWQANELSTPSSGRRPPRASCRPAPSGLCMKPPTSAAAGDVCGITPLMKSH